MTSEVTYLRVCVLGDSLATGRDATIVVNSFGRLIVSSLVARNTGSGTHYLIHGVGGAATGALTSSGDGMLANLQAFGIVPQADLLIIELGTNDWAHNIALSQFTSDYAALLSSLVTSAHQPLALVCLTPWVSPTNSLNSLGESVSAYTTVIQQQVAAIGAQYPQIVTHVVDLAPLCANADYHGLNTCIDTFHPNDGGHNAIANAVLAVV